MGHRGEGLILKRTESREEQCNHVCVSVIIVMLMDSVSFGEGRQLEGGKLCGGHCLRTRKKL